DILYPVSLSLLQDTRPPRSTLSPYTTLFRSVSLGIAQQRQAVAPLDRARAPRLDDAGDHVFGLELRGITAPPLGHQDVAVGQYQDRKSTRLNSSHVKISYAVFCLKKKKKNKT